MSGIMQRIVGITRSNLGKTEAVNNYADTKLRLNAAMVSLTATINDLTGQRIAGKDAIYNATAIHKAYELRESLLSKLVEVPEGTQNKEVVGLYETAKQLKAIALNTLTATTERVSRLNEALTELQSRRDELKEAQSKLDLAQQMVTSRERLALISSRAGAGELSLQTDFRDSLREATALAREAEALAELKGLVA